jgi:hypothetical protein
MIQRTDARLFIQESATLNFPVVAGDGTVVTLNITAPGARAGDPVVLGIPIASMSDSLVYQASVTAANTVTVTCTNTANGGTIDPPSGLFTVLVIRLT